MSKIEAFISTDTLFLCLNSIFKTHDGFAVALQRFESDAHKPGFKTLSNLKNAAALYNEGDFKLIYLSLAAGPKNATDWDFIDREEEDLLEIAGARERKSGLEMTSIRPLAKKTNCKGLLKDLEHEIKNYCERGVLLNGHPYPKIYYESSLASNPKNLFLDLDDTSIKATLKA